jgi:hypothetical protein
MIETAGDHRCQLIYSTVMLQQLQSCRILQQQKTSTLDLVLHLRMNALQTLIRP